MNAMPSAIAPVPASLLTTDATSGASCGYHRITLPFGRLQASPKVPVFVFNRAPRGGIGELLKRRAEGARIVADIDDYWVLPGSHYLHHQFARSTGPAIAACVATADVVLCSTAVLAERVRTLNPNIVIVPNALPFDEAPFAPANGPRAGFVHAGGPSHFPDLQAVASALNVPDVHLAGAQPTHAEWRKIRALAPRAQLVNEAPVTQYMRVYDGRLGALAPLANTEFNACKSNLKALEAGARRLPLIASQVQPYDNAQDRCAVLYAASAAEFAEQMERLRTDPAFAKEMGDVLGDHVRRNYALSVSNEIRRQVIEGFR